MKIYLATPPDGTPIQIINMGIKLKYNLLSYYFIKKNLNNFHLICENSESILIDSGAFSFINPTIVNKKNKFNFKKYTKNYCDFIYNNDNDKIEGYFEMDVDILTGYNEVLEFREMIEEVTDKIIPVWHKGRGVQEFKRLCQDYSYIGLPIRNIDIKGKKQIKLFVDYAHHHGCRIHGLAGIKKNLIDNIPFDSVDSSTWALVGKFSKIYKGYVKSEFTKTNIDDLLISNYYEYMKMQEYYYNKWQSFHND